MDEILIEEKRYVSSKRAAKLTGYAKDYVGQLCREGRVPARLVGRSWYVLESAIQDHRFGNPEPEEQDAQDATKQEVKTEWESPRYEASTPEVIPSVNRLRDIAPAEVSQATHPLQDSWKAWFDRVIDTEAASAPKPLELEPAEEIQQMETEEESTEEVIPIRTVYDLPPEDLLPRQRTVSREADVESITHTPQPRRKSRRGVRTVQFAAVVLAGIVAIFAALGTGYLDEYVLSSRQVAIFSGISIYDK